MITGRKKRTALHAKINGEKEDYTNCLSLSLSPPLIRFLEREREREREMMLSFWILEHALSFIRLFWYTYNRNLFRYNASNIRILDEYTVKDAHNFTLFHPSWENGAAASDLVSPSKRRINKSVGVTESYIYYAPTILKSEILDFRFLTLFFWRERREREREREVFWRHPSSCLAHCLGF